MERNLIIGGSIVAIVLLALYTSILVYWRITQNDPEMLYQEQLSRRAMSGKVMYTPRREGRRTHSYGNEDRTLFESYEKKVWGLAMRATKMETVLASYYGDRDGFDGKCAANGEIFDKYGLTIAHRTLKLGTLVVVSRGARAVLAMVTDRGPYVEGRDIDLSYVIARYLGVGIDPVELYVVREPEGDKKYHHSNPRCLRS